MREITKENAFQVSEETTKYLKEIVENVETFQDFAEICACLRDLAKTSLLTSGEEGFEDYSNDTKTNLDVLTEILDASAKLFSACYYDFT